MLKLLTLPACALEDLDVRTTTPPYLAVSCSVSGCCPGTGKIGPFWEVTSRTRFRIPRNTWLNDNTHTTQTARVFLHFLVFSQQYCSRQDFCICFCSSVVRSLLCVSRTDILEFCCCSIIAWRVATAVLGRKCLCMSKPHSYTAHLELSVVLWLHKTYTLHR